MWRRRKFSHQEATHVLGLIDKAIDEKDPDYVYQPITHLVEGDPDDQQLTICLYVDRKDNLDLESALAGPACVVGHVLVYDGMPLEDLAAREGEPAESVVPYRGPIAKALSRGQAAQDRGATWRQARDAYVSYLQGIDRAWCP